MGFDGADPVPRDLAAATMSLAPGRKGQDVPLHAMSDDVSTSVGDSEAESMMSQEQRSGIASTAH